MPFASELMNPDPVLVAPDLPALDLAELLLQHRLDGACVSEHGKLLGVVTLMDLVRREASVAVQPYVTLLDRLVPGGRKRKEVTLSRVTGESVRELMSSPPKVVQYDNSLEDVAALMVDEHLTVVPVMREERLIGVIHKADIIRAAIVESAQARKREG